MRIVMSVLFAFALMSGVAVAQDENGGTETPTTPEAAKPAPKASAPYVVYYYPSYGYYGHYYHHGYGYGEGYHPYYAHHHHNHCHSCCGGGGDWFYFHLF